MKRFAIVLFAVANWTVIYGAQTEHSTSPSRQFLIYSADAKTRGAISGLAEQTKTNLLALLRQRDDWKTSVVVNLQPQQANDDLARQFVRRNFLSYESRTPPPRGREQGRDNRDANQLTVRIPATTEVYSVVQKRLTQLTNVGQ